MNAPRVLIVDGHAPFRAGVRVELAEHVDVVGEAATVEEAVNTIAELRPDVVLVDVHMADGGGAELLRQVTAKPDPPLFLALSVSDAAEDVIAVIRAGARGSVTKSISARGLAAAIARVNEGGAVFSPRLADFVLDAFAGAEPSGPALPANVADDAELDHLTPREQEVLRHMARGDLYREVALRLGTSAETVEAHVSSVLRKLQLSNRHQLSRRPAGRRPG